MFATAQAKIRWDKCSPSILTPLFSQLILLMMACCRYDVNSLGEMLSPCLAPRGANKNTAITIHQQQNASLHI